jgi:hypothetical protein
MKKRPRRKPSTPPPTKRRTAPPELVVLEYKVVELSTVDEATLEETLNGWVPQGWTVESVHFAMRDSSKRPAMAFVFFTRSKRQAATVSDTEGQSLGRASARAFGSTEAWERLAQLAASGENET